MSVYRPGTAPIKAEYVLESWPARSGPLREAEREAGGAQEAARDAPTAPRDAPPPKKRARGQNKGRTFARTDDAVSLCTQLARGQPCQFGDACRFGHDLCAYLTQKARDLPRVARTPGQPREAWLDALYAEAERAEEAPAPAAASDDPVQRSVDFETACPYFEERGACPAGWRCRFLGGHVERESASQAVQPDARGERGTGLRLRTDAARMAAWRERPRAIANEAHPENDEVNWLSPESARRLRSGKYVYEKTPAILSCLQEETRQLAALPAAEAAHTRLGQGPLRVNYAYEAALAAVQARAPRGAAATEEALEEHENALRNVRMSDAAADRAKVRPAEKRRLDWRGELYLAPLTTTGNLPFRRVCASFGSDIHCGEMALAESFTAGHASEWSLTRRWDGERVFGTQVCGAKPEYLVPAAEALAREVGSGLDFVDVNCGCPIDLVYNKGAGSALLDHASKLGRIVRGMNEALGEIPVTIKLRTGTSAKQTTHKIFARAQTEWGVGGVTLHGRSRKQRYKNDADWAYIGTCAQTLRDTVREWNESARTADEPEMAPVPIYGNGDVYGFRDYYEHLERTGVDGEMIARGALIKPWVFTEIKERRDWDISARERLDIVRQFADYGLTHWGADTQGVNTTRRFLCEMLSFTHRYIPLGLLEHVPVRMNDRPPPFQGRDALETLLSSPSAADWVRISEMFLGKAPDHWSFLQPDEGHQG
ncbi:tRNA-dihydrouridine(47) synthase [NAD(P)(+)] [Malassezia obtusa]|uniref:tRNA-dihydrouridine(47) synthase [NAD(P)(+)] n=1 Tax=Malassezia obtusa TaxID=76774 RepID=A0AAF0IU02_9BASI|nr:tRNA-dihydrouridine(47) synthase [NAD(P)(+)] [Malassezia obtusa]